jgi:hypothetical protein
MAHKNNRKESLYDKVFNTFKVGDGAHFGFNGGRYPVTVVKVSDSGREVSVSHDFYQVIDNPGGYVEGNRECEFTTITVTDEQLTVFKLNKSGFFVEKNGSRRLCPKRQYACNPSF